MTHLDPMILTLIYLLAMVITVPIANRLGLGAVLGYLLAGIALGPSGLGWLGRGQSEVLHIAEFGVIMMLFLIGMELRPTRLWQMRGPIFGLGGAQVLACSAALAAVAHFVGLAPKASLAAGMVFSLSSTAIVLQTLQERGALKTTGGQSAFAVLLFQDMAVIPMLAIFPLLGTLPGDATQEGPAWLAAAKILGAVTLVILTGRYLIRPVFHLVGASRLRELFTAMALLLVIGITLLMQKAGLSPALGAFLAGVVLADNEYRHQLEVDIEPFKGLLLGVFFISVGAGIDLALLRTSPTLIGGLMASILIVKWLILAGLGRIAKLPRPDQLLFASSLAQGGEFAFVLLTFGAGVGIFSAEISQQLTAAVALSMFAAPLMIQGHLRWIQPRFAGVPTQPRPADTMGETRHPVIIAGFGRFGQMVTRLLRACGIHATVLDYDVDQIEVVRRFGHEAYYGDATSMDLLRAAGADHAKLLIIAIDEPERALAIVDGVKKEFPQLPILARAYDRVQAYEMIHRGIAHPYIETAGSALQLGIAALRELGMPAKQAHRAAQVFNRHNDEAIQRLAKVYHEADEATFLTHARNWISALEGSLGADRMDIRSETERGWDAGPRRTGGRPEETQL